MAVSENNSVTGILIIQTKNQTVCIITYLKGPNNQSHSKGVQIIPHERHFESQN